MAASLPESPDDHVRVRLGKVTAFVCIDVNGGARGDALRSAAGHAFGISNIDGYSLVRSRDQAPIDEDISLARQGIAVDELILLVRQKT